MKKILAIILVAFLCGCDDSVQPMTLTQDSDGREIKVVTIEGCEYFKLYTYGGNYVYTHKGNCKNPIHIYKNNR